MIITQRIIALAFNVYDGKRLPCNKQCQCDTKTSGGFAHDGSIIAFCDSMQLYLSVCLNSL